MVYSTSCILCLSSARVCEKDTKVMQTLPFPTCSCPEVIQLYISPLPLQDLVYLNNPEEALSEEVTPAEQRLSSTFC